MIKPLAAFCSTLALLAALQPVAARPNFYEAALDLYAAGEFSAAAIELRNALQESPGNVPARVLLGQVLLRQDKPREAAAELEKGLELGGDQNLILIPLGQVYMQLLEPEKILTGVIAPGTDAAVDGEILLMHGDAALILGDLNYAQGSYAEARERIPQDARPLLGAARIALARGKDAVADELIAAAVELDPASAQAWTLRGMVLRDRGDYAAARDALDRALSLDPQSTKALGARAAMLLDAGDETAAVADIAVLREANPNDLEGLYLHSWMLLNEGEHERALQLLAERAEVFRGIALEYREKLPQTELLFGMVSFLSDEYEQAVAHFTKFLARFPKHDGARRYLAATYLAAGDWDNVIRTLNTAPGEELPSHPATLSLLAEAFRENGNFSRSIRLYDRALEISPHHAGLTMGLAASRFAAGQRAQAISALEELSARSPDLREAKVRLIGMYVEDGREHDALPLAAALTKTQPDDAGLQNLLGATMMAAGRFKAAQKQFELAAELDPADPLPRLNQARLALRTDNLAAAIGQYRAVLEREPDSIDASLELADALIRHGDAEAAAPLIETVVERQPDNLKARLARLWVRVARGESQQLETDIFELTQQLPDDPVAQIGIARIYAAVGDMDNARLLLRRAGENAGFNAVYLYEIALEQLSLGDAGNAHWAVTKALNGNPRHLGALAFRVVVLLALERYDDAEEALAALQAAYPERSETYLARGDLLRAAGKLEEAVEAYAAAHRIVPTRATVRRLFEAQVEIGDVKAALRTIRVWILLHPDDMGSRHALAEKLIAAGEYRPAQLVYEGILKRSGDDPLVLNNLAFVLQKMRDERAIDYARQAVEIAPEQPGFLDTYGWILAENGEPERGLEILRDAQTRQSTNEEIRYHIALALLRMDRADAARRELSAALSSERGFPSRADAAALLEELGGAVN